MPVSSIASIMNLPSRNTNAECRSKTAEVLIETKNTQNIPTRSVTEYLNNNLIAKKVLVVGCGMTPEKVIMGTGPTAMAGLTCSLGRHHINDFTVDISADAGADLTINLLQKRVVNADLETLIKLETQGFRRFDEVHFEYLSKGLPGKNRDNVFSQDEISAGITSAHNLLKSGGKIVFYNGDIQYRNMAMQKMNELGYKGVTDQSEGGHIYCEGLKNRL